MYAIIGATGRTGRVAVETLRTWGMPVRALVRCTDRARDLAARGAELAAFDLDDEASLVRALTGVRSLYLLTVPPWDADDPVGEAVARGRRAIRAARAAGVEHVVLLSSFGAQHPAGTGPIAALHALERELEAAKIPSTFLRAGFFAQNWADVAEGAIREGVLASFLEADRPIPMVDVRDVGRTAAELLAAGPGHGIVELAGPEDVTPRGVAAAFAAALRRPVELAAYPPEAAPEALAQQGVPRPVASMYGEMFVGLAEGRITFEGGATRGRVPLQDSVHTILHALAA